MYAAAGGASLASRQARQRQRQNKKAQTPKATNLPAKQPQQFPNYTDQAIVLPPKLSRVERNALRPPSLAPTDSRRHSTSNYHLSAHQRCLRESPSICMPVQQHKHLRSQHLRHQPLHLDLRSHPQLGASTLQLPQVHHLATTATTAPLERRCSFVRQVEEMERPQKEAGILDRCNHMCNFEVRPMASGVVEGLQGEAENALLLVAQAQAQGGVGAVTEYERGAFGGSTDYPFSECSQGRAAWVERERGRRCSVSDEAARQQRLKQSEAHHRWMKRNRIHDTSYGGSSDGYEDDYSPSAIAYHQSAAANALLYVGLGTAAIGSIIFFVGTGEKGFKTLELRLIGPTLVACGLLCCLVRILLCACTTSTCRKRAKTKQQVCCQHNSRNVSAGIAGVASAMLPPVNSNPSNVHKGVERHKPIDKEKGEQQQQKSKKKVCITTTEQRASTQQPATPQPSTSHTENPNQPQLQHLQHIIPTITEPEPTTASPADMVELIPLDTATSIAKLPPIASSTTNSCFFDMLEYDLQSVSDDEDDDINDNEQLTVIEVEFPKHTRTREPRNSVLVTPSASDTRKATGQIQHSGIVLSPAQLKQ